MMGVGGILGSDITYATQPNYLCAVPALLAHFGTRLDLNIIDRIPEFSLKLASAVPVVAAVSVPE